MKIIFLSLLFFSLLCHSQEPAEGVFSLKDGTIYYEKIITLDSTTKENIYIAVKSWGVNAFKSQKDVLQADEKEIGLIAYKYWFAETFNAVLEAGKTVSFDWKYYSTLKIFIKNDKVKIVVQDIELKNQDDYSMPILTLNADMESVTKKLSLENKDYAKYDKEVNTPEVKAKRFSETKRNFEKANKSILTTIEQLAEYLKSGKSEFDF
jgi:Domain of unknown function (DUF4468) with TBP-like fold